MDLRKATQVPLTLLVVDSCGSNERKCNIVSYRQIILDLGFRMSPGWGHIQAYCRCEDRTCNEAPTCSTLVLADNQKEPLAMVHSFSCSQQIKTECLPRSRALAKHVTELYTGTTVKHKDSQYSHDRWDDVKSPSSYGLWIEETQIVYWISQISEWPLETTCALICMCSQYNYTFKLGKQFHLHFCTWPGVLQGLKISPSMFYYTSYWNLRTCSCSPPFPSLVSFHISQRISGLDPNSGCEPELAHFLMHGNIDSPSCHEYCVDELHPWQGSSQTQLTAGSESDKLAWKLEWEAEEERRFTREGEVWEDDSFSFTILSVLQTFSFMA